MTNLFKKVSLFLVFVFTVCALFGCVQPGPTPGPVDPNKPDDPKPGEDEVDPAYLSLAEYKAYILNDLETVVESIGDEIDATVKAKVDVKANAGREAIAAAKSLPAVQAAFKAAKEGIASVIPYAEGIKSYASVDMSTKTKILGIAEAYAVRNGITGISLFENGSYVMYHERVTLGTENYITGYGFGTLAEGNITAPLATEANEAWKYYYHTINANDPGTANYLNDQGSEVSDFYSYFGASYFTTFMNATKDGYDWVPELAKEKPVALNADASGMATKWRFEVRVGAELKYNTNSSIASRAAFNGREVALEDYITPFKLLLTKSNGLYRGTELANSKSGAIKGAKDYYDATTSGPQASGKGNFEETVGIKAYVEDGKSYLEFEFTAPLTPFYAMYYTASSLYMPVPQEFLDLVTVQNYLGYNADKTESPVDNSLSLGSYTLERWDSNQQVVYKKNPYYVYADSKYAIQGIHINILAAATTDPEAGINEFLAGKTDSTGIPKTKLEEYKSDPRTRTTKGTSNFKLNVNALSAETWEVLFGENGRVTQTPKDSYWEVKPCLSNAHFVKGLSLSINRFQFASARGNVGSVNYLSSNYMSDPENGISYNATKEHAKAVEGLLEGTDGYGYNLELAREYFRVALSELEAAGAYTPGTKENPTVITLEIAWQAQAHEDLYHNEIAKYLMDAFNDESVSGGKYKLDIKFWVGNVWSDVYYGKMMLGQFDLGFGSISGNTLNPLDFMTVLSADQEISGGFTLNWGTDTNDPDADILVYDGLRWSYDALVMAGNATAIVKKGAYCYPFTYDLLSHEAQADGSFVSVYEFELALPALTTFALTDVALCWYELSDKTGEGYKKTSVMASTSVKQDGGKITVTVTTPAELVSEYYGSMGFDFYYDMVLDGSPSSSYVSVRNAFPKPAAE